jgi:hypothetical protein
MNSIADQSSVIAGRSCGPCTLCCKVLSIKELGKPQGSWCQHCDVGRGCRIYSDRPSECQGFYCGYLTLPMADDHWFPARCKMVIVSELDGNRVAIHVDPDRPSAWRNEPYYSEIKHWARLAAQDMMQVVVSIGNRAIVILPEEDVDLGPVAEDEQIFCGVFLENGNRRLRAMKIRADDPRLAGMKPGVPFGMKGKRWFDPSGRSLAGGAAKEKGCRKVGPGSSPG